MKRFYNLFAALSMFTLVACSEKNVSSMLTIEQFNKKLDSTMVATYPKVKKEIENDMYGRWNIIKSTKIDSILAPPPINSQVNLPEEVRNFDAQNINENYENTSN